MQQHLLFHKMAILPCIIQKEMVERANRTILSMLVTVMKDHKDGESYLRATYTVYNSSI